MEDMSKRRRRKKKQGNKEDLIFTSTGSN